MNIVENDVLTLTIKNIEEYVENRETILKSLVIELRNRWVTDEEIKIIFEQLDANIINNLDIGIEQPIIIEVKLPEQQHEITICESPKVTYYPRLNDK